ncbi:hypothetical protein NMG60_11034464 [Bertholletia excelsa]
MDRDCFFGAGLPQPLLFEAPSMPAPELSWLPDQPLDCFLNTTWDNQTDLYADLGSALSSMVSSPAASNSGMSNDGFVLRELIGKLGSISREVLPQAHPSTAAYISGNNESSYSMPLNSPPKPHLPITDHFVPKNLPRLGKSMPVNPNLPALSADPGFAERAAKFSCFGSCSFNGRTSQLNTESPSRSSSLMGTTKLQRISSSPSLKADGSPMGVQEKTNFPQAQVEMKHSNGSDTKLGSETASEPTQLTNCNEGSSVSEQIPNCDSGSRKRKAASKGKSSGTKVAEGGDDRTTKKPKCTENSDKNGKVKTEEEAKATQKPPEPPKDYIHVRARRGQATDSHSLAERVRREKISERMKLLQDLVPGCNKVTGKALMLDEIINYVQSLQRQVEFLSMKLATVNPRLDSDAHNHFLKDVFKHNGSLPNSVYPSDSSAPHFFGQQVQETHQAHTDLSNVAVNRCSMGTTDPALCQKMRMQFPLVDELGQGLPQFPTLCEDDLQRIVQTGLGQNPNFSAGIHSQSFPGSSQTAHKKAEL